MLPIVAVLTDMALHNPRTYPLFAATLSKLLTFVDEDERRPLLDQVVARFRKVPYSGHLFIWLQRFVQPMGLSVGFDEPLCKAMDEPGHQLWNSDWLPGTYSDLLSARNFIDQEVVEGLKAVIAADEVQLFDY